MSSASNAIGDTDRFPEPQRDEPGKNYDGGKARWDLLPYGALDEVVAVFTAGAEKYAPRNWERGMSWSRHFGSLVRHLFAWWRGQDLDQESGLHHLAHVVTRGLMLLHMADYARKWDDRPKDKDVQHG